MHVHILGICGTFMGGIAALARAAGHRVTGADQNVYPPMSTQLEALGIDIVEGYGDDALDPAGQAGPVIVGEVLCGHHDHRGGRAVGPGPELEEKIKTVHDRH